LTFLDRLSSGPKRVPLISSGSEQHESLVRWLVSRQTTELGDEEDSDEDSDEGQEIDNADDLTKAVAGLSLDESISKLPHVLGPSAETLQWAGFNGRCNKYADTCYSFWNTATLDVREDTVADNNS
jgi:geranylgeranyl transferase type-1 subunit beta